MTTMIGPLLQKLQTRKRSEAEVRLPRFNLLDVVITEGGVPVWKGDAFLPGADGVAAVKATEGGFAITVGSGRYVFELRGK